MSVYDSIDDDDEALHQILHLIEVDSVLNLLYTRAIGEMMIKVDFKKKRQKWGFGMGRFRVFDFEINKDAMQAVDDPASEFSARLHSDCH